MTKWKKDKVKCWNRTNKRRAFSRKLKRLVGFLCFIGIHDFEVSTTETRKGFIIYKCKACQQRKHVKTDIEVYG
jgi:hypothetical protein